MDPVQLYQMLAPQPFRPMRIVLKDGRQYDIPSREMAIVGVTYLDIGIQATDAPEGIWGSFVTVPLEAIQQVEPVGRAQAGDTKRTG
jgi:hypothetical protein